MRDGLTRAAEEGGEPTRAPVRGRKHRKTRDRSDATWRTIHGFDFQIGPTMNAKELVKRHGLAYCAAHTDDFSVPVLRALAKVAEDYGKEEFREKFLAVISEQKPRTRRSVAPV